jgi:hypothetical protein
MSASWTVRDIGDAVRFLESQGRHDLAGKVALLLCTKDPETGKGIPADQQSARKTIYVSIGNSDNKLTQREWSGFVCKVAKAVRRHAEIVHGEWASLPFAEWQNAAWCFEVFGGSGLRVQLSYLASEYRQDSIAWAEVPRTEFIPGELDPVSGQSATS